MLAYFPNILVFLFLLLCFYGSNRRAVCTALFILVVSSILIRPLFIDVGGDVAKYQYYFYNIDVGQIVLNQWLNSLTIIAIRAFFADFYYYQLFVILMLVYSTIVFSRRYLPGFSNVGALLILTTPLAYSLTTIHIVFAYSFAIALIALTYLGKSRLNFLLLILLSSSIHWSMILLIPAVVVDKKIFIIIGGFIYLLMVALNRELMEIFQYIPRYDFSYINQLMYSKVNRNISHHHIYLFSFLTVASVVHYKHVTTEFFYRDFYSIVWIKFMIFFLIMCFIVIDNPSAVVRLGFFVKFFFLIYVMHATNVLYPKYKHVVAVSISFISLLISFSFSTDRYNLIY